MATARSNSQGEGDQRLDDLLRNALNTPPISNEEIERRSKAKRQS